MKRTVLYSLLFCVFALVGGKASAQDAVMVYNSWEAIFDQQSDTIIFNPHIEAYTPCTIEIIGENKDTRNILDNAVAVALGDSIWLINSNWLKKNFSGDCKKMDLWVPLFFSAKVAFVQWTKYDANVGMSLLGALFGDEDLFDKDYEATIPELYLINFEDQVVEEIDHKVLSRLLSDYPDLQRRYEGMKDYKKTYMINTFFLDYIDRLNADPNVPYLF